MKTYKVLTVMAFIVPLIIAVCIVTPYVLPKHNENWIIGKTVYEVVDRYGEFVFTVDHSNGEGMSGYYIKEESHYEPLFGDYIPEKYLVIYFDENGIANKCFEEWGAN